MKNIIHKVLVLCLLFLFLSCHRVLEVDKKFLAKAQTLLIPLSTLPQVDASNKALVNLIKVI